MNKRILHLPVKAEFFHQMQSGEKTHEYRLQTDYWHKRLVGREYDEVHVKLGYPRADDTSRILVRPWRGYEERILEHSLFGPSPKAVFAIKIN